MCAACVMSCVTICCIRKYLGKQYLTAFDKRNAIRPFEEVCHKSVLSRQENVAHNITVDNIAFAQAIIAVHNKSNLPSWL